jgi:formate dehydrogenase (NADP+) beta subunit
MPQNNDMAKPTRHDHAQKAMAYPPCKLACPIQTEAREYIQLIAERRYDAALSAIKRQNPLPRICGRICTHPCETVCKRGQIDEPIAIAGLKRFAADGPWTRKARTGLKGGRGAGKVAVIGSGPAGLSAAHFLALLGHHVTIFEKLPVLGGMMAVGIPSYRLPRDVLDDEVASIRRLGVEMRPGVVFGEDLTLDSLGRDGYQAFFVATGLHRSRPLGVEGEDLPGVINGVDFLRDTALGRPSILGERVLVVGGGNVAVDVARTALRTGAREVSMVCLEKEDEMPAWESEMDAARQEGVVLLNCYGPSRFLEKAGRVAGVDFKYCSCVFDEKGAFCPSYDENNLKGMQGDTVIVAIGQAADLSFAKNNGLSVTNRGGLSVDSTTLQTSIAGVFAGGDVVSGPATVTEAIAAGKRAATSIHCHLMNEPVGSSLWRRDYEIPRLPESILEKTRHFVRSRPVHLPVEKRLQGFGEVEPVLSEEQAVKDALRCLHCYLGARVDQERCISCLTCVRVCPVDIPRFSSMGEISIDPFLCQACGMCAVECPVQAIDISLDSRKAMAGQLAKVLNGPDTPRPAIVGFFDLHGSFLGCHVDELQERFADVLPIMVFGSRRIDVSDMLKAFEYGADAVFVALCPPDRDPFPDVRKKVEARAARARAFLEGAGLDGKRLEICTMPAQGIVDLQWLQSWIEGLKESGSVGT